jgi:hypothetical protein
LKLSQDATCCKTFIDVHKVTVDRDRHEILTDRKAHVGSGFNSGFQALNLLVQFGCKRIALVGFDMALGTRGDVHWHGRHKHGMSNPAAATVKRWRGMLDGQAKRLKALGVEVVNCSPISALTAFPKMGLLEAIDRWSCPSPPA